MKDVLVRSLDARGDGLIEGGEARTIAGALPGERIELDGLGRLAAVLAPSPERVAPFCRHFGLCGGCRLQHWAPAAARAWKRQRIVEALHRAGLEPEVHPTLDATGKGRRRVILHLKFDRGRILAGFMAARSHDLIDLDTCPVLVPELAGAADVARGLARPLARRGKPLDVQLTATEAGLDVDIRGHGRAEAAERLALIDCAERFDLARLAIHGEMLVERRPPLHAMGRALVNAPPGGFLQATQAGEEILAAVVSRSVGGARKIVDLFCGAGPFALRLAASAAVTAYDSDQAAIAALLKAARAAQGLKPVAAEARDLFRRPLLAPELAGFDAVVLDPPRAGAEGQARQLGLARVPRIVYVSCDVASFVRDAGLLAGHGLRLDSVTPVDQFAHTPHIELVGVFSRSR